MMADQIITVEVVAWWKRVLLLVPAVMALVGAVFAMRWGMGDTLAQWLPEPGAAQAAEKLAPADPQTHYTLALLGERSFQPDALAESARQYEQAVRLSPNDYRLWTDLGRVRSLVGDVSGSEQAFRRALELAPAYADPRWLLGNQLLRQGRNAEAFAELRRAGDANPGKYRAPVFDLAWHVYQGDVAGVLAAVGASAPARAQFIEYLLNQKRLDDALRLWSNLGAAEREEQKATGDKLLLALFAAKRFAEVLAVRRDIAGANADRFVAGRFINGGFEEDVGPPGKSLFDWQVAPATQTQINLDTRVRHGGARSLRLVFNVSAPLDFRNVSQLIIVTPLARYRLQFYVRTEDLKSASTLLTEVVDAGDAAHVLAASSPLSVGTSDWQLVTIDFSTGAQTQAVTIRLGRPPCLAAACPLFGKVWYDDFDLQRLGASAAGARADNDAHAAAAERKR